MITLVTTEPYAQVRAKFMRSFQEQKQREEKQGTALVGVSRTGKNGFVAENTGETNTPLPARTLGEMTISARRAGTSPFVPILVGARRVIVSGSNS